MRDSGVGVYADRVFPAVMNRACNTPENRRIRADVCAGLAGDVVEIGFGSGLNLPHLPPTVDRVLAVDPLRRGRVLAAERIEAAPCAVEFVGLDGQSLELEDRSGDHALSTWTLCSIPDPVAAVRELARVLRPGGTLHFAEHGKAPDPGVRRWQGRLNWLQRRVACGCTLDKDLPAILTDGGLTITELSTFYADGVPKIFGWTYVGTARRDQ